MHAKNLVFHQFIIHESPVVLVNMLLSLHVRSSTIAEDYIHAMPFRAGLCRQWREYEMQRFWTYEHCECGRGCDL